MEIEYIKFDGRRNYKVIDGRLCEIYSFTHSCSGCYETIDGHPAGNYPWDDKSKCYIGAGCFECGYTGKRICCFWAPVPFKKRRIN